MSNEMIERVATALYQNSNMTYGATSYWRMMAKAAIAAMREPSTEMIDVASGKSIIRDWQSMIDAALKE